MGTDYDVGSAGPVALVMRDFFLVIFMTFLLCYFVRRVVNMALAWIPPSWRTLWVDRGITITIFVALLAVLAGLLGTLVPKIVEQSRTVFFKIEHAEWQVEFDGLLHRTVGAYCGGDRLEILPTRDTRKRWRYFDEISAELAVFSRLLGKSLEAQIVIAALIAVATFVAMWWLGVDNKHFLAMIVFLSNLIPIVGVLIATAAMAVGAVLQPDGTIWLAVQIIIASVCIHLATHSIISPRIVGKWFHLHPVLALVILVVSKHFLGYGD